MAVISPRHVASLFVVCVALWLLLSGQSKPLLLGLGLASVVLTLFVALRMEILDHESHPLALSPKLVVYWIWLAGQVVLSSLAVSLAVLAPRGRVAPATARIATGERSDIGHTIFANSITLTPGTVSMAVEDGFIEVHSLNGENIASLQQGEMLRRIPDPGRPS
ncbi:MAG: Na+/H+ antiporter subunit E [Porticoccaceae bacterium]|nr:Na+/H+ antiporter subunit E [Porticoccaceae bacterium]MEA3301607.1 Na+/H+ antiporter subunit E [Pseudomonadota bacterium]